MFRKKLVPIVLVGCMLTAYIPTTIYADGLKVTSLSTTKNKKDSTASSESTVSGSAIAAGEKAAEPSAEKLETIIKIVKSKINIPEKLTQFDYNFNSENPYSVAAWNLNWYTKDSTARVSVTCDQEGNITNYYSAEEREKSNKPKYLKTELKSKADQFIKKAASDIFGKLQYVGTDMNGIYDGGYTYLYQRVENGIPMPDNSVTVSVNFETGKVADFNSNWLYHTEIPSPDTKITKKQAAEKIGKTINMKLSYENAYTTEKDGKTKIKAFLVYSPDHAYTAVDAKTGEVYTTQNDWVETYGNKSATENASVSDKADGGLTEEEIQKVDEIKGLISKEAAIKAITDNKNLLLDKNLKSITAKLYKQDYYDNEKDSNQYVWNISLNDPREVKDGDKDTYRAYANASVDARTGKIISFQASVKDYYNMTKKEWETVKVNYSLEQGQKVLEQFLEAQIPDKFKNSKLTDHNNSYVIAYKDSKEVYGGYYYNYDRVNEGIVYSYNGINGAVDGVTGKIYSFSCNWNDDVTFEEPKDMIRADAAYNLYIANEGFHLVYEVNRIHSYKSAKNIIATEDYSVKNEVRLVYRTDISPSFISPFTGKQLDYDGKEYVKDRGKYTYSDLGDTSSKRNIELLAELGIGFEGGSYKPEQAITSKELTDFLSKVNIYYDNKKYILKNDSSTITRLQAAKFAVQVLGYENIAELNSIYNVDVNDKDKINSADLGYVALAQGLKLVLSDSTNAFRPDEKLTRAEAADMLVGMLGANK